MEYIYFNINRFSEAIVLTSLILHVEGTLRKQYQRRPPAPNVVSLINPNERKLS